VTVNPYATPTAALLSITSGLQVTTQPAGFQILPANSKLFTLSSTFLNSATGQPGLQPGIIATATVNSSPIPIGSSPLVLTVNDRPVPILSINGNQILFQVPQNTAIGPITVRLDGNSDRGIPVAVSVDAPPQPQVSNVIGGTPTAN
jgi:hypothetical protein